MRPMSYLVSVTARTILRLASTVGPTYYGIPHIILMVSTQGVD